MIEDNQLLKKGILVEVKTKLGILEILKFLFWIFWLLIGDAITRRRRGPGGLYMG
jgi:hypothetical protein